MIINLNSNMMKTVLNGYISSVIRKIENGFNDVSTLTPDIEGIPFQMNDWIQISGPLFYSDEPKGDIIVTVCINSYVADKDSIYRRFGFSIDDSGVNKCYKWEDMNRIADEVEEMVIALVGEETANAFVSDEVFIEISNSKIEQKRAKAELDIQKQKRTNFIIYLSLAILTPILLLLLAWIMGEI